MIVLDWGNPIKKTTFCGGLSGFAVLFGFADGAEELHLLFDLGLDGEEARL